MSKIYFNLDQLGDDQTLLGNALKIALDNNPSSVMLTRADCRISDFIRQSGFHEAYRLQLR